MLRKYRPFLLLLLLASASLDDAWAEATPDPVDDAQAAENNEYLRSAPDREGRPVPSALRRHGGPAPCPRVPHAGAPRRGEATPSVLSGPPLLYALMSLRC